MSEQPRLVLKSSARSPAAAAAVVNTWAAVSVEQTRELVTGALETEIELVKEQLAEAEGSLRALEGARARLSQDYEMQLEVLDQQWRALLCQFDRVSEDFQADYRTETERLFNAHVEAWNAPAPWVWTGTLRQELLAMRLDLAQVPQELAVAGSPGDGVPAEALQLQSGESIADVSAVERKILAFAATEPAELRDWRIAFIADLESLQRSRSADLDHLLEWRRSERRSLVRTQRDRRELLRAERRGRLGPLQDELSTQAELVARLTTKKLEAERAAAGRKARDIILHQRAVPARRPDSRRLPEAAAAGLCLGLLSALAGSLASGLSTKGPGPADVSQGVPDDGR
ncbi:MAG: hypothetical protein GY769_23840 [bacterium]|nr:hypothetical protein [bacterium]